MRTVTKLFHRLIAQDNGANMIEYIMIFTLIALVCVAGYTMIGSSINAKAGALGDEIQSVGF